MAFKLHKSIATDEDDSKIDMSPMIDMVFLLLIFFIVNATAIIVRTDPEVQPPVAPNGIAGIADGRIVINVRSDGTCTAQDLTVLPDEDAIRHYVGRERDRIERLSQTPRLYLRGDKESLFKHGRLAVRAAADAGVNDVLFATFNRESRH